MRRKKLTLKEAAISAVELLEMHADDADEDSQWEVSLHVEDLTIIANMLRRALGQEVREDDE